MNKKIMLSSFLAALILSAFSAQAEKIKLSEVPDVVLNSVKAKHPEAKNIQVDKELHFGMKLYEVKFKLNGRNHEALFEEHGRYFGHEKAINISALPQAVIQKLRQTFKTLAIHDAEIIEHPDGRIEYEIDVKGDGENWELAMSPTGKIWVKERD